MVFQIAKLARKSHMVGAADVLIAQEHHTVLEQGLANFRKQAFVMNRIRQTNTREFRANRAGQLFYFHALSPV